MKKALFAIALVLSLLLAFTSCDGITDLLGSALGIDRGEENTQSINTNASEKPEDEDEDEEDEEDGIDDPSANISSIVSAINEGINLGSLIETDADETVDYEDAVKQLRQAIEDVAFSKDITITAANNGDKATVYGYAGAKDGVVYASISGTDTYMFVEDDFKIVTVEVGEDGSCYAEVEDELYEYIEMLLGMGQEEITSDEDAQKMIQFLEKVVEIKLPEIRKKEITYDKEDGRYYFADKYIEEAIDEVARKILEDYYEVYPEETPEDIYAGLEEGIAETLEMLNLKLWINARNEEITGFGLSVDVSEEYFDEADDIGRVAGVLEVVSGNANLKVVVEGTEDYEANCTLDVAVSYAEDSLQARAELKLETEEGVAHIKGSCKMDKNGLEAELYALVSGENVSDNIEMNLKTVITADEEGLLQKAKVKCDFTGEYDGGVYEYDDYGNSVYVNLSGTQTLSLDFEIDLNNIENNGTIATFVMEMTADDFEAYLDKYDQYGYLGQEYSEKYTRKYAGMQEYMYVDFEVTSSERGDTVIAKVEIIEESLSAEENVDVSIELTVESSSKADFNIPDSVQRARREALDNYGKEDIEEDKYYY